VYVYVIHIWMTVGKKEKGKVVRDCVPSKISTYSFSFSFFTSLPLFVSTIFDGEEVCKEIILVEVLIVWCSGIFAVAGKIVAMRWWQ